MYLTLFVQHLNLFSMAMSRQRAQLFCICLQVWQINRGKSNGRAWAAVEYRLYRLRVINEMDLGRCTRCIFITWGLLIIVCQTTRSNTHNGSVASASEKFDLMVSAQFMPSSYSHRVLLLTVLCTLCLALLSCGGKWDIPFTLPELLSLSLFLRLLLLLLLLWLVDT